MSDAPDRTPARERTRIVDSVTKRSLDVGRERAMVEEVVQSLRDEERRLRSDLTALQAERKERDGELALVRRRLDSLEESLTVRRVGLTAKEHELGITRYELERKRELVRQLEQEVIGHRERIAAARARIADLISGAIRIRHRVLRAASFRPDRGPHD